MIASATIQNWTNNTRKQLNQARAQASDWDLKLRAFAREQPLMALASALAAGYVLARVASRLRS